MKYEESVWINKKLKEIPTPKKVLDVGSSTINFRTNFQNYIDENIFKYLRKNDAKIKYLDMKSDKGVDIVADVSIKHFSIEEEFDLVLCCSLLEHVNDLDTTVKNISTTVGVGGYLIVTMPYKYQYHLDPIDNLNRFSPNKIRNLFWDFELISSDIVKAKSNPIFRTLNQLRSIITATKKKNYPALKYNIRHCLFRDSKVSCVLLRKIKTSRNTD